MSCMTTVRRHLSPDKWVEKKEGGKYQSHPAKHRPLLLALLVVVWLGHRGEGASGSLPWDSSSDGEEPEVAPASLPHRSHCSQLLLGHLGPLQDASQGTFCRVTIHGMEVSAQTPKCCLLTCHVLVTPMLCPAACAHWEEPGLPHNICSILSPAMIPHAQAFNLPCGSTSSRSPWPQTGHSSSTTQHWVLLCIQNCWMLSKVQSSSH